jgi:prolyl oligopeptidase
MNGFFARTLTWLAPRFSACLLATVLLGSISAAEAAPAYPEAAKGPVVDDYFGTRVADPYRWLEDVDAPETLRWIKAQQALTTPFLAALPEREPLKARITTLWNFARRGLPRFAGNNRFYTQNDGLQNQAVLYVEPEGGAARALIDPNPLSADGATALTAWEPSDDGQRLAYTLAEAGSDWETLKVRDVASGQDLPDVLSRVKFSGLAWTHDGRALVYSRYPEAAAGAAGGTFEKLAGHSLWLHRLGTPQSSDKQLFKPEDPSWTVGAGLSEDGRWLLASVSKGASENNRLLVIDLQDADQPVFDTPPVLLGENFENAFQPIGNVGSTLYLLTSDHAPKRRVIAVDLTHPKPAQWRTVVAEGADVITQAQVAAGRLIVHTLHDASSRLTRYSLQGHKLGAVTLPGLGDASNLSAKATQRMAYFSFTGFATPPSNYRLDMHTGTVTLDWAPKLAFKPADYVTEQVFYKSRDGTRVPMFISYKKGLKKSGANPALLYGYGGFNISLLPSFSVQNLVWMEAGGVYAQPNLRGGGEYGEAWHLSGTKAHKQNVFDDFAAAAQYLIAQRYTSPKHLGIYGRSNGGLLIGATLNQHPELFAAAVPGVGVMDMLRFHLFTIGAAWRDDYGSSETAEGFAALYPYSPVHNIKAGAPYPPTLTITADHDDRVVPGHSFKYAAAMQAANADNPNPQLIRIEERGGHGAGKPVGKKIEEIADVLAFLKHYTQ